MVNKPAIFLVLLTLMSGTGAAQGVNARAVLQAASRAMGTDTLKCITYSGSGYVGIVGQNYSPGDDWARVELASYTRSINFDARSFREEQVRRQGNFPRRGGGGIPIQGDRRQIMMVLGEHAWNLRGTNVNPQPAAAAVRELDIWMNPHGFLKAAMAASDVVAFSRYEGGAAGAGDLVNVVSFMHGNFRVTGSIDERNLVVRVQTFIPTPFFGDTPYELIFGNYRDFDGVMFPNFHVHTAWDAEERVAPPNPNSGHNSFQLNVDNVQGNVCAEAPLTVPEAVRRAAVPPVRVESEELAEGVYYLTGGSHHSVAVEFEDFVAVVEAPQNEQRSLAIIDEVKRLFPNKRLRYLVNTHHHFDHSGGLRAFVHEGVSIITHRENADFYYSYVLDLAPRTLEPDRLALYPPDEFQELYVFETVNNDKYSLSDGTRILDLYYVRGNPHAVGMLMAYLPTEKILIEADLFTPPAPNAPLPATPSAAGKALHDAVKAYNLDVSTIAPLHGRTVSWSEFLRVVGETGR